MPARVGTLDALGLAVYRRADGSIYFNKEGARRSVHGNTLWTTTDRVPMRGDRPRAEAPADAPAASERVASAREDDELALAIAASLRDLDGSRGADAPDSRAPSCVVCLAAPVDRMMRPCNHACVCAACAPRLDACPICRGPVASIERIWLA